MKFLYKNIAISLIYYFLTVVAGLYITKLLIAQLGIQLYGFFPIANNISNYLVIISMAINSMAARFISVSIAKKEYEKANQYYSSLFFSDLMLAGIMIIPIMLCVNYAEKIFQIPSLYIKDVKFLLLFVLLSVMVNMITTVFSTATVAKDRIDIQYIGRISQVVLKILLFAGIYIFCRHNVAYAGGIIFFLEVYYLILQFAIKRRIMPELVIKKKDYNISIIKQIIHASIWNSVNQLGNSLLFGVDAIVANILVGAEASGIIGVLHMIPGTLNSVITLLAGIFVPKCIKAYSDNNNSELDNIVKRAQEIMGVFVTTLVCLSIIFGKNFFNLYLPEYNSDILARLSNIYLFPLIFTGVFWSVSNLNIIWNNVKIPALFTIINGILNLFIMVIFLAYTEMGIVVIPITTSTITILWYGLFIPIYVSKKTKIQLFEFYKIPFVIIFILCPLELIIYFRVSNIINMKNWFDFFFWGGLCGIFGLLMGATIMKIFRRLKKK